MNPQDYADWVAANGAWFCEVCQRLTALPPEFHIHDRDQGDNQDADR